MLGARHTSRRGISWRYERELVERARDGEHGASATARAAAAATDHRANESCQIRAGVDGPALIRQGVVTFRRRSFRLITTTTTTTKKR